MIEQDNDLKEIKRTHVLVDLIGTYVWLAGRGQYTQKDLDVLEFTTQALSKETREFRKRSSSTQRLDSVDTILRNSGLSPYLRLRAANEILS